jgi:hypothetical protein
MRIYGALRSLSPSAAGSAKPYPLPYAFGSKHVLVLISVLPLRLDSYLPFGRIVERHLGSGRSRAVWLNNSANQPRNIRMYNWTHTRE